VTSDELDDVAANTHATDADLVANASDKAQSCLLQQGLFSTVL
jgi:hypothetical protein